MCDTAGDVFEEEWVIWNGNNGLLTTVTIGEIEEGAGGKVA
jgi:hypothetical protein